MAVPIGVGSSSAQRAPAVQAVDRTDHGGHARARPVVCLFVPPFMRYIREPVTSMSNSSRDDDQAVLDELARAGSQLDQPHVVDHFLYFASDAIARQAADQLAQRGYAVTIDPPLPDGDAWRVRATRAYVPSADAIDEAGDELGQLASALGGEYDGWETGVVR